METEDVRLSKAETAPEPRQILNFKAHRAAGRFGVWSAEKDRDRAAWLAMWQRWPQREVFAHPAYLQLFAEPGDLARCAYWRSPEACVIYPFILRDVSRQPAWSPGMGAARDIITAYGYGGPYAWGERERSSVAHPFWKAFGRWAEANSVVSEFVRFSLFDEHLLPYPGHQEEHQPNVVRVLDLDEEALWADMKPKVRRNVRRARSSGVTVEFDTAGDRIEEFHRVYLATMDRRGADPRYYFSRAFFEQIRRDLRGQFVFCHGIYRDQVVATELVLISAQNVYFFLGGSDYRYVNVRPNELVKHEIIRWARTAGKKRYVLGGGYHPEDGVFRFKRSFAPSGIVPFTLGKRIFDPQLYDRLVARRDAMLGPRSEPDGFFPAYRQSDGGSDDQQFRRAA